jgi:hypothetical protein
MTFFPSWIRYIVADGYYSKYKWVTGVVQLGFHAIGKLRCDANLKFLYEGPYAGRGAPRRYDGKVNLQRPSTLSVGQVLGRWGLSLHRRGLVCESQTQGSVGLSAQRAPEVVAAMSSCFPPTLDIDPLLLYRCYNARFQIEFVFRDARQFTGLADCQARSPEAIDTHVNASLMALNLAKVALQENQTDR